MVATMNRICAWCKKDLDSLSTLEGIAELPITHGMCGDCARKVLSSKAMPLKNFLDQFPKPVFLVDAEGRIVIGNSPGCTFLHKKPEEVDGKLGGEAFDCNYARLPGGCGQTIHCKTCTIRLSVMDTLESGNSRIRIPAFPDLHHLTGEYQIRFLISTEKVGEAVLLQIDEVTEIRLPRSGESVKADKSSS
jgi:PAS domain-containing protein